MHYLPLLHLNSKNLYTENFIYPRLKDREKGFKMKKRQSEGDNKDIKLDCYSGSWWCCIVGGELGKEAMCDE